MQKTTMKMLLAALLLCLAPFGHAQTFCPEESTDELLLASTTPVQTSVYFESFGCWTRMSHFRVWQETYFPSGIDLVLIITEINGPSGSLEYASSQTPVSVGDTIYLVENGDKFDSQIRHLQQSSFSFEIRTMGQALYYEDYSNCAFTPEGMVFLIDCMSYGIMVVGSGDCATCTFEEEKPEIVKIVDLLGRETVAKPNQVQIYIYSDGTMERVFFME